MKRLRRLEDERFCKRRIFKQSNHFFFDFQLYIDFKIYPLKLAYLEPWASLIHWPKTRQRRSCFLSQSLKITQKRKSSRLMVHQLFKLVSASFGSCHITFEFWTWSLNHVEEALKVRYFMRSIFLVVTLLDRSL